MAEQVKDINQDMARKFLEKERAVGIMMAVVTAYFFLAFLVQPILRAVMCNVTYVYLCTIILLFNLLLPDYGICFLYKFYFIV